MVRENHIPRLLTSWKRTFAGENNSTMTQEAKSIHCFCQAEDSPHHIAEIVVL